MMTFTDQTTETKSGKRRDSYLMQPQEKLHLALIRKPLLLWLGQYLRNLLQNPLENTSLQSKKEIHTKVKQIMKYEPVCRLNAVIPKEHHMVKSDYWCRSRHHYTRGIWKRSFIPPVKSSVYTNLSRKRSFNFENALQTGGFWKRRLCVLVRMKNILKTSLFETLRLP